MTLERLERELAGRHSQDWREATLGLVAEVGGLAAVFQLAVFHGRDDVDDGDLARKLAKVLYYVTAIAQAHNLELDRVAAIAIAVAQREHPNGWTVAGDVEPES